MKQQTFNKLTVENPLTENQYHLSRETFNKDEKTGQNIGVELPLDSGRTISPGRASRGSCQSFTWVETG